MLGRPSIAWIFLALAASSCGARDDALRAGLDHLASLTEAASRHRAELERRLATRDDLGPGEYQERLRAAHADLSKALAFEEEARAAALLAQLAEAVESAGAAGRRHLHARLPQSLAALADLSGIALGRGAYAHAARASDAAATLRARVAAESRELKTLRQRILRARTELARTRLVIAEQLGLLGDRAPQPSALLRPIAQKHGVRIVELRPGREQGDERLVRERLTLRARATKVRAALAFVGDLGKRAGLRVDGVELGRGRGVELTLSIERAYVRPGQDPLPTVERGSTLARVESALARAELWREALASAVVPRPGPLAALSPLGAALPKASMLTRFAGAEGRFSASLRMSIRLVRSLVRKLEGARDLELSAPAAAGRRVALRGRYHGEGERVGRAALETPRPIPRALTSAVRALVVGNAPNLGLPSRAPEPDAEPERATWRLVGVASATKGEVRALLRDPSGRAHIVGVGHRLDDGAKVVDIKPEVVTTRLHGETRQIRAGDGT